MTDNVNHPPHYGGGDNPYEAIKVIEAWGLGFHLGNALKYILRAKHKGREEEDYKKALWYLRRASSVPRVSRFLNLDIEPVKVGRAHEVDPNLHLVLQHIRDQKVHAAAETLNDWLEEVWLRGP